MLNPCRHLPQTCRRGAAHGRDRPASPTESPRAARAARTARGAKAGPCPTRGEWVPHVGNGSHVSGSSSLTVGEMTHTCKQRWLHQKISTESSPCACVCRKPKDVLIAEAARCLSGRPGNFGTTL